MFQSTRRRLALWYTAVTAILLLLFATGMYIYVRNTLIERIDDTLKHVVEVVERSLVIETFAAGEGGDRVNVEASFRNNAEVMEDDHIDLEWFSPTGELLWSTFSTAPLIPLQVNRTGKTIYLSNDNLLRQVTQRVEQGRQVLGYLRVSHPWFEVTKPTRQLVIDLVIWTSFMVVCVGAIGWFLSGLAMKPILESYQSLKQFTADASHELRNPIATIQTNVQMALTYLDQDPQSQQRQLRVVERLTQRLGRLVNDLLFLARSDSGIGVTNAQTLPLDALLIEVIEEQRVFAQQRDVYLCLRIEEPESEGEDAFAVLGEWDQLARLFTNLISNGIEYTALEWTDKEGEALVEVILGRVKRDRRHWGLQVQVRDNGVGIPEAALPYIFDRFYRVDSARSRHTSPLSGSGLGLAIAWAIAQNHHGDITVESVLHQGTTFSVTLPVLNTVKH
ncbi:sensor histidine kinase [Spirulina subsalsa FACHB-351]|uniref:histidine kinase n=1 Tax=Spirulina subsalsa FACHB-351 TaxID=234711 RepID=A0ABT3LAY7_9CYAN|nr:ATP-binding protein [Spirulina subsalsa]MCW6038677.1 sensor histidine kinase [Spirulina subsalsa FACHB-351]